jgi:hypothetical protein
MWTSNATPIHIQLLPFDYFKCEIDKRPVKAVS